MKNFKFTMQIRVYNYIVGKENKNYREDNEKYQHFFPINKQLFYFKIFRLITKVPDQQVFYLSLKTYSLKTQSIGIV